MGSEDGDDQENYPDGNIMTFIATSENDFLGPEATYKIWSIR